jgi:hypothetical protein
MRLAAVFKPDYERDGVRPFNVYLLRLLFLLVFVFVGYDSWTYILNHEGSRDHVKAAAFCMWASYSLLSILGVFHPLKLSLVLFEIIYKSYGSSLLPTRCGQQTNWPVRPPKG